MVLEVFLQSELPSSHRKIIFMAGVSVLHMRLFPTHCTNAVTPFKVCAPPRVGVVIAVKYVSSKKNIAVGYDSSHERARLLCW